MSCTQFNIWKLLWVVHSREWRAINSVFINKYVILVKVSSSSLFFIFKKMYVYVFVSYYVFCWYIHSGMTRACRHSKIQWRYIFECKVQIYYVTQNIDMTLIWQTCFCIFSYYYVTKNKPFTMNELGNKNSRVIFAEQ